MKILITGGAGFIGYHLAKKYSDNANNSVTIIDNFARENKDKEILSLIEKENVTFIRKDLTKIDSFNSLTNDFDIIYHFAAINGTNNFYTIPDMVLKVGVLSAINILDWYIKNPKGRFILASSSEAYAGSLKIMKDKFPIPTPESVPLTVTDPRNVRWSYGSSKILSEVAMFSYAHRYNLDNFTIIRFHNIIGTRMGFKHVIPQFIERVVNKINPFPIYGGQETRAFCDIADAICALEVIATNSKAKGEIIHVGKSDEEIKIIDVAKKLFEISGFSPKIDVKPAPKGCVARRCPDTTKLKNIGFVAKIPLKESLKEMHDWYKDIFITKQH